MYVTNMLWWGYTLFVVASALFMLYFALKVRQKGGFALRAQPEGLAMERSERLWFGLLVLVALVFNAVTLSPLVPWQKWLLWSHPAPDKRVSVEIENYEISLPPQGVEVKAGEFVEFLVTSKDVTYGFGVFRPDGPLVFQMQVVPSYENKILWKFDAPGTYDVRSTEYSGPRHPEMFIEDAIRVIP